MFFLAWVFIIACEDEGVRPEDALMCGPWWKFIVGGLPVRRIRFEVAGGVPKRRVATKGYARYNPICVATTRW